MPNLPEIFTEKTFGDLVTLPTVYQANTSLLDRTKVVCDPVVASIPADLKALTPEQLDELDTKLNGLQVRLSDAEKLCMERRKPFTQFMDRIKSEFTSKEKGFTDYFGKFKTTRDAIAKERVRRAAEAQKKQDEEIQKKQELVMLRTNWVQQFTANFTRHVAHQIERLNETYNKMTADELEGYGAKLRAWNPAYKNHAELCAATLPSNTTFNDVVTVGNLHTEVSEELFTSFNERFVKTMFAERDRLIELIPSRINELKNADAAAIQARLDKEKKDAADKLERELAAQKEQAQAQGEADLLNATFEVAASAEMPIEQTKGAVKKLKYVAESHAAYIAIIQSWVQNDLPGMSMTELETKLKFMVTAANKRLNEGVKLEAKGLNVIEDISTRASKVK